MEQIGSENVSDYLYTVEVGNSDVKYWEQLILSAVCFLGYLKSKVMNPMWNKYREVNPIIGWMVALLMVKSKGLCSAWLNKPDTETAWLWFHTSEHQNYSKQKTN